MEDLAHNDFLHSILNRNLLFAAIAALIIDTPRCSLIVRAECVILSFLYLQHHDFAAKLVCGIDRHSRKLSAADDAQPRWKGFQRNWLFVSTGLCEFLRVSRWTPPGSVGLCFTCGKAC